MSINRDFIYTMPQAVLTDNSLNGTDLRVYMLVRSFMDTTGDAYFSNEWAAKKLNVDRRTIIRSILKLVKKSHLQRSDINGHRHLIVAKPVRHKHTQTSSTEGDKPTQTSSTARAKVVTPPVTKLSHPSDKIVTQLDQKLLLQNTHTVSGQTGVVCVNSNLKNKLAAAQVQLSDKALTKLLHQHSSSYIDSKLELLTTTRGVQNPTAWLMAAIESDWRQLERPKFINMGLSPDNEQMIELKRLLAENPNYGLRP